MEMTKGKTTVLAVFCMLLGGTSAALVEDGPSTQGYEAAMGKMHQGRIVAAEESEIEMMQTWLKAHGQ